MIMLYLLCGFWISPCLLFFLIFWNSNFIYFNQFILIGGQLLYNIVVALPHINMNQPQVYMCPPSRIPFPPSSWSHRSGLSQCTGFECPVSSIKFELSIYFTYDNNIFQFSQISPPSPSQTESKSLLFISVSLLLSYI